jgi:hypothetical protein
MTHAAVLSKELPEEWTKAFRQASSVERRSKLRFPLELRVHYHTVGRGEPFIGMGFVVNMSSSGLFVAGEHEAIAARRIKLTVEWPVLLDGQIPLQLVIDGKVVRCEASGFAVELHEHQFRTCKRIVTPIDVSIHGARGSRVKELPLPVASHIGIRTVQSRRWPA